MLFAALTHIHRDPFWWRTIGIGAALMLTGIGFPLGVGLVVEYMENCRKGFATPLPPWYDWSTRYLIGLFALLIDFFFFVLPLLVIGLIALCVSVGIVAAGAHEAILRMLFWNVGGVIVVITLGTWLAGLSPTARLHYISEGKIEDALGSAPLRLVFAPRTRGRLLQMRLATLPAYLPCLLVGTLFWNLAQITFPFQWAVLLLLAWLTLGTLLYAHLVVGQIYATHGGALQ